MFNHFGVWIISSFPIFYFHFRFFTHTIAHVTNGNLSNLCNVCCAFSVSISGTVHGRGGGRAGSSEVVVGLAELLPVSCFLGSSPVLGVLLVSPLLRLFVEFRS